ncbi:DUF29 domain-containing protein [Paraburkholderia sp. A1RO-5L]|uniref:DUF29 domain-containing protein n=1 Tax=unclassified Paraburkholderia TaxID=2615204 RepID=UPI003B7D13A9
MKTTTRKGTNVSRRVTRLRVHERLDSEEAIEAYLAEARATRSTAGIGIAEADVRLARQLNAAKFTTGYNQDFMQWAMVQAKLLRERRFDELDLDNLVEEVESIGHGEEREFANDLHTLLTYLLKWRLFEQLRNDSWRSLVSEYRTRIDYTLRDSPILRFSANQTLSEAFSGAVLAVAKDMGVSFNLLPEYCPWEFDSVIDNGWMPGDKVNEETISHDEFQIGMEFYTESGRWRCTDVGTRTIAAVKVEDGPEAVPPYSVAEHVFDEYDFGGLYRHAPK